MARNRYLVDHSQLIIAYWDGRDHGGTFDCLKYAKKQQLPTHIINP